MKAAALADRLDDLLNPVAVKELRQAVKSRIVLAALLLFLFVQLTVLLVSLVLEEGRSWERNLQAGRVIFQILQGILLGTCIMLVPLYAGIRLTSERSDTNVDLLFISTLRPRGIIAGKLQASVVLILLIFSACAPFMTFTYLLRGIDMPSIVLVLVLDFLVVLLCTQAAIFLGAVPGNLGLKSLLGLPLIGLLFAALGITMSGSFEMVDLGLGSRLDSIEFWLVAGSIAAAILAAIGLMFTWSVALISPPSVNRALPVRLCLLGFWLMTGGAAALLTHRFHLLAPLYIWEMPMVVLLCAQILVSINEREQWGPRVARTIPRRWWLRWPAFLMYSGAAGGVLFAVLLLLLTLACVAITLANWTDTSHLLFRSEIETGGRNTFALLLLSLYSFDYFMSAVWLRNALLSRWLKPSSTWAAALVLLALGTALPWPLLFYLHSDVWSLQQVNACWQISNPFSTIYAYAVERDQDVEFWSLPILGFWGLVVLAAKRRGMCMDLLRDYLSEGEHVGQRYALRLPRQTPRGAAGLALGQRAGSSLEFKDHREYQIGDDLRHIDWNAFARSDQLSVKLYREEITPHIDLVLDVSRSMALEDTAKERATVALAALLATAAANAGFGRAVWLLGDDIRLLPNGNASPSLWGDFELSHRGSPAAVLARGMPAWRPRGVRVLLSDLLWVGEPLLALRPFTEGAAATAVIQLLADADSNPPQDGALRLIDSETEQIREIHVDEALARRYRDRLMRHQQNWHQACRASGAIFTRIIAETLLHDWKLEELIAAEFLRVI